MIRPYNESDIEGIVELLDNLSISEEAGRFEDCLFDADTYREVYFVKKSYSIYVAVKGNKIIGFVLGDHYCNDVFAILMLYVHPAYRREYFALRLKEAITNYAKENGYKEIISQVRTNNPESIRMNKRAGWEIAPDKVYPGYYVECRKELK